ncbi:pollen-specific leucine-rich repeat extensin-like protein 3 [Iris pallida]|uniref:Pollen-specific leucine-rich repeat extensin-like protein 3 n=1 Tax=Iris pallida TaxID=29817 RepID=A0AAX6GG68_IRIPA|nr:pollen-specific leucine-rich repeat extensin-like protein 3 [Iris pallida]KAJ6827701.1 pollen-specific leucine-rich repeat extensin-like protein 3 [Iris pallida]
MHTSADPSLAEPPGRTTLPRPPLHGRITFLLPLLFLLLLLLQCTARPPTPSLLFNSTDHPISPWPHAWSCATTIFHLPSPWSASRSRQRALQRCQHRTAVAAARSHRARARAVERRRRRRAHRGCAPLWWATSSEPPWATAILPGATHSLFVRFARRPVVTRAK